MTEVHYRTQIEALKNWKRMVKIRCDRLDCSGNCQRLLTLRFMPLGHEVSRALIHLLSLIFSGQDPLSIGSLSPKHPYPPLSVQRW